MEQQQNNNQDTGSLGWWFLGFFIPFVGVILFIVYLGSKPKTAKMAGWGALSSCVIAPVVLFVSLFAGTYLRQKYDEKHSVNTTISSTITSTDEKINSSSEKNYDEVDTTDLSEAQVVDWITYVLDNWENKNGIDWSYKITKNEGVHDPSSIYYRIQFNKDNKELAIRINPNGVMEFGTNQANTTPTYEVLSRSFKDLNDIDNLTLDYVRSNPYANTNINSSTMNTNSILNGDFSTLAGTWKNGKGSTLIIDIDGTVNNNLKINNDITQNFEVPTISVRPKSPAAGGFLIYLFKAGELNPKGDTSNNSKDRIIGSQNSVSYFPPEEYYYRQ